MRWVSKLFFLLTVFFLVGCGQNRESFVATGTTSSTAGSSGLPLPSALPSKLYEEKLYTFIGSRKYVDLGWTKDKTIRDTGPFQNGVYYGTHPAVRVYYSPEVITWLKSERVGVLPDGAMIIKEMFQPPAARYTGRVDTIVPTQWTIIVRDSVGSKDGWYWSYFSSNPDGSDPPVPQAPDNDDFPFNYQNSGFGLYCVRCHASADNTLTFASTENIEGFPGRPQVYAVDNSWISRPADGPVPHINDDNQPEETSPAVLEALKEGAVDQEFLDYFNQFPPSTRSEIQSIPPTTTDHVVAQSHRDFFTSDQCMSGVMPVTTAHLGPT